MGYRPYMFFISTDIKVMTVLPTSPVLYVFNHKTQAGLSLLQFPETCNSFQTFLRVACFCCYLADHSTKAVQSHILINLTKISKTITQTTSPIHCCMWTYFSLSMCVFFVSPAGTEIKKCLHKGK